MIKFKTLRYMNFLSTGNAFTEIQLDQHPTNLIVGENGAGKCLRGNTEVNIDFLDEEARIAFERFIAES